MTQTSTVSNVAINLTSKIPKSMNATKLKLQTSNTSSNRIMKTKVSPLNSTFLVISTNFPTTEFPPLASSLFLTNSRLLKLLPLLTLYPNLASTLNPELNESYVIAIRNTLPTSANTLDHSAPQTQPSKTSSSLRLPLLQFPNSESNAF